MVAGGGGDCAVAGPLAGVRVRPRASAPPSSSFATVLEHARAPPASRRSSGGSCVHPAWRRSCAGTSGYGYARRWPVVVPAAKPW